MGFRIDRNEVKEVTIGLDVWVGNACHVQGTYKATGSPSLVVPNGTLDTSFGIPYSGGAATLEMTASFSLTGYASGTHRVPYAWTSSMQRTTVNASHEPRTGSRQ